MAQGNDSVVLECKLTREKGGEVTAVLFKIPGDFYPLHDRPKGYGPTFGDILEMLSKLGLKQPISGDVHLFLKQHPEILKEEPIVFPRVPTLMPPRSGSIVDVLYDNRGQPFVGPTPAEGWWFPEGVLYVGVRS